MNSNAGFSGTLESKLIKAKKAHRVRTIRTPFGRFAFTRDPGEASLFSTEAFRTHLQAVHRDGDGRLVNAYDLGSGVITAAGALAIANDFAWPTSAATIALNTIRVCNNHATGTSSTAAALSDIALNTASTNGGQTMVAGVQTLQFTSAGSLSGTNYPIYQTVATISYTGTETVTEWGLFSSLGAIGGTALSSSTGTPFTAGTATTGTVTGTPLTASANGTQGQTLTIIHNTGNATPSWGLVTSNTTSVVTVPAWFAVSNAAAGANPANTNALVFRPLMLDHKVFTGIGVNNGDSIQFTYKLSVNDNT